MTPTVDTSQVEKLQVKLDNAVGLYPKSVVGGAMRQGAGPMLSIARQEAPVGKGAERVSIRYGKSKSANAYRRGGSTRRDLRIKVVDNPDTLVSVLVGVSKASGRVGWRTHFITRGVRMAGRARSITTSANDFLKRTYDRGFSGFFESVSGFMLQRFEKYMGR